MKKRKILFLSALILTLFVLYLLISGSAILTIGLDQNDSIPLGTFITWVGMISLPLIFFWGIKEFSKPINKLNKILSKGLKTTIIMAILWLPISYLLSGNLSFTFSNTPSFQGGQIAMKCFWYLSYGIGIGAILIPLIYWLTLIFRSKNN